MQEIEPSKFVYLKLQYPECMEVWYSFTQAPYETTAGSGGSLCVILANANLKSMYDEMFRKFIPRMFIARVQIDYTEHVLGYGRTSEEAWQRAIDLISDDRPTDNIIWEQYSA